MKGEVEVQWLKWWTTYRKVVEFESQDCPWTRPLTLNHSAYKWDKCKSLSIMASTRCCKCKWKKKKKTQDVQQQHLNTNWTPVSHTTVKQAMFSLMMSHMQWHTVHTHELLLEFPRTVCKSVRVPLNTQNNTEYLLGTLLAVRLMFGCDANHLISGKLWVHIVHQHLSTYLEYISCSLVVLYNNNNNYNHYQ